MARRGLLIAILLLAACATPPSPTQPATLSPKPSSTANASPAATPTPTPALTPTPTATPAGRVFGQADFANPGGCGDVFIYATSGDDATSVTVEWRGAASAAWDDAGFHGTKQIPDGELDVTLNVGQQLSTLYCTDIGVIGPHVDGTAHAIGGQVELRVTPDAGSSKPASHADIALHDVVFEVLQGTNVEHWRIDELVIQGVSVGWFAG